MPIEKVIILKLFFALGSIGLYFLFVLFEKQWAHFLRNKLSIYLFFLLTRLLPFVVIYLILKIEPRGDIPFFYTKASNALQLKLVYRDFISYHSPLFAYIIAIPLLIWHNPAVLIGLMILGELLCLIQTNRLIQKTFNEGNYSLHTILYFLLPAPTIMLLFGGQEDIWLWGIYASGLIVYHQSKNILKTGLVLSCLLICLKITSIFIFIPLFFQSKFPTKIKWLLGVGIPTIVVFGTIYLFAGNSLFMFIQHTKDPYSPNIFSISYPFLLFIYENHSLTTLNWAGLFLLCSSLFGLGFYIRNIEFEKTAPYVWIITFGLFNMLLPASMIYYTYIYMIAIFYYLIINSSIKRQVLFLFFNLLIIIQPYLFVVQGNTFYSNMDFIKNPLQLVEYISELALVGMVSYYIYLSIQAIQKLKQEKVIV